MKKNNMFFWYLPPHEGQRDEHQIKNAHETYRDILQ